MKHAKVRTTCQPFIDVPTFCRRRPTCQPFRAERTGWHVGRRANLAKGWHVVKFQKGWHVGRRADLAKGWHVATVRKGWHVGRRAHLFRFSKRWARRPGNPNELQRWPCPPHFYAAELGYFILAGFFLAVGGMWITRYVAPAYGFCLVPCGSAGGREERSLGPCR